MIYKEKIKSINADIKQETAKAMQKNSDMSKYLQDSIVAIRAMVRYSGQAGI